MVLEKVVSGAQTGVERAALIAAKECGLATGGWMPKDYLTLDGNHPEFAELYGMQETTAPDYGTRTILNVRDAGATLRYAVNLTSPGEKAVLSAIRKHNRPYLDIDPATGNAQEVADWIRSKKVKVLNVSGSVERKKPNDIEASAVKFFTEVFQLVRKGG